MAYKIVDEGSDFYTVQGVPIFQTHTDRGFPCDVSWMNSAVQNHALLKAGGYRPTIVVGHNRKGGVEKESVGFLDNLVIKGKLLYADLVRIPKAIKEKIVKNAFPNRSVEVLPKSKRILCMALLGGTTPHFALPQIVYANKEKGEWYPYDRSNEMELTEEQKKEIYELVGAAVAEAVPEQLVKFLGDDGDEDTTEIFLDEETGEEYAVPAALAKLLSAGGKVAGKIAGKSGKAAFGKTAGKVIGKTSAAGHVAASAMRAHPKTTIAGAGLVGANVGALAQSRHDRKRGYSIDEETGEVAFDGEPLGMIVTYTELAEAGMEVPGIEKHPEALPSTGEAKPALKIKAADVGVGSGTDTTLTAAVADPTGPGFVLPLAREDSDQFLSELEAQNYDLHQRITTVENANALITQGRRAEEYEKWLTDQKAAGVPVGDITETIAYMMSQGPEAVEEFKKLMLASPKVALGKMDDIKHFDLASEDTIKADFAANKDVYLALGVNEKDLAYSKYTRINRGVGEEVVTG